MHLLLHTCPTRVQMCAVAGKCFSSEMGKMSSTENREGRWSLGFWLGWSPGELTTRQSTSEIRHWALAWKK